MITRARSIVKSLSYRVVCSTETFLASFTLAHFIYEPSQLAGILTTFLFCLKLFTYYLHERVWNKIKWGINDNAQSHRDSGNKT